MDIADQERTGLRYSYSVFQAEYSRNLLFRDGRQMDQVFSGLIDRIRRPLDIRKVKTLFGRRQRPRRQKGQLRAPAEEIALEKPAYDLTILRIHFGRVTLKIYTKGERVLRTEAMAHNIRDLRCRLGSVYFPEIVGELRKMVDRFVEVLDCLDTAFIDAGLMDELSQPGRLGAVRVGGLDINRPRIRAVMEAVLALSPNPRGFTSSELAARVGPLLAAGNYTPSRAAYDLRKLRCKGLVRKKSRGPAATRPTPPAFELWRLCSSSVTACSVRSSPPHRDPSPHSGRGNAPSWTASTPRSTTRCATSSPTSGSPHEQQHRQLFHDVRPTSGLVALHPARQAGADRSFSELMDRDSAFPRGVGSWLCFFLVGSQPSDSDRS